MIDESSVAGDVSRARAKVELIVRIIRLEYYLFVFRLPPSRRIERLARTKTTSATTGIFSVATIILSIVREIFHRPQIQILSMTRSIFRSSSRDIKTDRIGLDSPGSNYIAWKKRKFNRSFTRSFDSFRSSIIENSY